MTMIFDSLGDARPALHRRTPSPRDASGGAPMIDPYGRHVTYLRVSVTDRCDFRCSYCMAEDMEFLPKRELLTLEELDRLCTAFIAKGVRKLRLTGGEPLVRRGIMDLIEGLSRHLRSGALDELTLTTNGSQLARFAERLAGAGVRRVNVSVDTLDPARFHAVTRRGDLLKVLDGIAAAKAAGIAVKINAVAVRGVMDLIEGLGRHLRSGALDELTLTTNGSQLARFAPRLVAAGVRRVNVSVDTLDPDRFRAVTRRGDLAQVLEGIAAARRAGLAVKINAVAVRGVNDREIPAMIEWAHGEGHDLTLIETMPLGAVDADRADQYLPLSEVREGLAKRFTLAPDAHRTGGPAPYFRAAETGGRPGFITPLTHNFCEACNRVRVTCTGQMFMCLGQDDETDLRAPLRQSEGDEALHAAIDEAIARKPKGHDFVIERGASDPAVSRHMSVTGG